MSSARMGRFVAAVVGAVAGLLAYFMTHSSERQKRCDSWYDFAQTVVERSEAVVAAPDAEPPRAALETVFENLRDTYHWNGDYFLPRTPDVQASKDLTDAARTMSGPGDSAAGARELVTSLHRFEERCR